MDYRIETQRATGRKAKLVAVLTVDEDELDHLVDLAEDDGHLEIEITAAAREFYRRKREG